jgi:hypothetical protein
MFRHYHHPRRFLGRCHQLVRRRTSNFDYVTHKETTRHIVHERLVYFCCYYADLGNILSYKKVAIRNQRSRWGSCSAAGNLNFNYRIFRLPPELQNYIIVHELCHTKELNHGTNFWKLVALAIPDWRSLRAELRKVKIQ